MIMISITKKYLNHFHFKNIKILGQLFLINDDIIIIVTTFIFDKSTHFRFFQFNCDDLVLYCIISQNPACGCEKLGVNYISCNVYWTMDCLSESVLHNVFNMSRPLVYISLKLP